MKVNNADTGSSCCQMQAGHSEIRLGRTWSGRFFSYCRIIQLVSDVQSWPSISSMDRSRVIVRTLNRATGMSLTFALDFRM